MGALCLRSHPSSITHLKRMCRQHQGGGSMPQVPSIIHHSSQTHVPAAPGCLTSHPSSITHLKRMCWQHQGGGSMPQVPNADSGVPRRRQKHISMPRVPAVAVWHYRGSGLLRVHYWGSGLLRVHHRGFMHHRRRTSLVVCDLVCMVLLL